MSPAQPGGLNHFPRQDLILIVGEAPGIKAALSGALISDNFRVKQIRWGQIADFCSNRLDIVVSMEETVAEIQQRICPNGLRVGAIINLAGFGNSGMAGYSVENSALEFFNTLKIFEKDVKASALEGGGLIFNITALGGRYGSNASRPFLPESAGTLGVAKSAALEWPNVRVRCIDIDPAMGVDFAAARLWEEIQADERAPEIGVDQKGRWKPVLTKERAVPAGCPIDSESVILLLGGASGITNVVAGALAGSCRPRMILVGRTPPPEEESIETRHLSDGAALKSFFIRSAKKNNEVITPVQINRRIDVILKRRQLKVNLEKLQATGASVEYHALDVRDKDLFSRLIEDIYHRFGRIDGVIHGAGIIDDQRIRDKSKVSFCTVYDTKVIPAMILSRKLRPATLKFLVLFSSVAARFGNAGQCDYSAANEVLNKLAHDLARKWSRTRVVSIGWGPWDSGMVTKDLKKFYKDKGIGLIDAASGADFFLQELEQGEKNYPEIVVTATVEQISDRGLGQVPK